MLATVAAAGTSPGGDYEILSQSNEAIAFRVRLPRYSLTSREIDGSPYSKIEGPGLVGFATAGEPDLPGYNVLLAVPPGADATLEGFSVGSETFLDGIRIAPVPRIVGTGEGVGRFAAYVYDESTSIYQGDLPFPPSRVWLADRGRLRHQDVIRVYVSPFSYLPAAGRLGVAEEITVTVSFKGGRVRVPDRPRADAWDGVYEQVLLNHDQAMRWRTRRLAPLGAGASRVENSRFKILIEETGIHRLGFAALGETGFPDGVPVDEIYVYRDEFKQGPPDTVNAVEAAIEVADNDEDGLFSSGDEVIFFAKDFYDQFGYQGDEDLYFDKNVYWLSWGGTGHKRMASRRGSREGESPERPTHFTDFVHVEKDSVFVDFTPPGDFDLFTWYTFARSIPFELPGAEPAYPGSLSAKFASYYLISAEGQQKVARITLLLKDCEGTMTPVDTVTVNWVPSIRLFRVPVKPGLMCDSGSVFRFESWLPSDFKHQPGHMLDWFEVTYERRYEAHQDMLVFTNGGLTGELEFEITNFSGSDIRVFDVTDASAPVRIELQPGSVTPNGPNFKVSFRDSLEGYRTYIAARMASATGISLAQMVLRNPPALRGGLGDYLVVSHPDFVEELDPLIQQRRAQGHSVTLATTEEVFDDFGNGMKSDVALKRFIEHGFFGGDAQFVLLVGDGNTDRKGILSDPPDGQVPSLPDFVPSHDNIRTDIRPPNFNVRPDEHWFVKMDGPSDLYPDLYIGRLPVGSPQEARRLISKILTFENYAGTDPWKKRVLVVADDLYSDGGPGGSDDEFEKACERVSEIARQATVAVDTLKYYLVRCTKDDQPEIRAAGGKINEAITRSFTRRNCTPELRSLLNSSALIVNYQGHSNRAQFTHEWLVMDLPNLGENYRDITQLTNFARPFIFMGYGCWMADFHKREEADTKLVGDSIAEKFVLNQNGAGCGSFASACAEAIIDNKALNIKIFEAMFDKLQDRDPDGNLLPARIVIGEALMTGMIRLGRTSLIKNHMFFGDPAMIVDMGPPLLTVSVNDSLIDDTYKFEGDEPETLRVVADIRDEEAVMAIDIDIVEDGLVSPVAETEYSSTALVDTGFLRSRAYEIAYDHISLLGDYTLRITAEDYSGKISSLGFGVTTGEARFFGDQLELPEGGVVLLGQQIRLLIGRPVSILEDDITVFVDGTPADQFSGYSAVMRDADGKQWEVTFEPALSAGEHTVRLEVHGFERERMFVYVPATVEFFADGEILIEDDAVSGTSEIEIVIRSESQLSEEDLDLELDGAPHGASFLPDSAATVWRSVFNLDLGTGAHELTVYIAGVGVTRRFQVSAGLALDEVSAYPNPFSGETYIFYTLSQDVDDASIHIYTVSGRRILKAGIDTFGGYNEFMWDGRDAMGDRVANGVYVYRVVITSGSGEKDFVGRLLKVE
jgi:hypothetical protein